jgi:hypothetical protein
MFSGNDPEFLWALTKAALIIACSFVLVVGLAWLAAKKAFPK